MHSNAALRSSSPSSILPAARACTCASRPPRRARPPRAGAPGRFAPVPEGPQVDGADERLVDGRLRVQPRQHARQRLRHQPRLVVRRAGQHLHRRLAHGPARRPGPPAAAAPRRAGRRASPSAARAHRSGSDMSARKPGMAPRSSGSMACGCGSSMALTAVTTAARAAGAAAPACACSGGSTAPGCSSARWPRHSATTLRHSSSLSQCASSSASTCRAARAGARRARAAPPARPAAQHGARGSALARRLTSGQRASRPRGLADSAHARAGRARLALVLGAELRGGRAREADDDLVQRLEQQVLVLRAARLRACPARHAGSGLSTAAPGGLAAARRQARMAARSNASAAHAAGGAAGAPRGAPARLSAP